VVKPGETTTGTSDLKYDESWIPEHHLKPPSVRRSPRNKNGGKKD